MTRINCSIKPCELSNKHLIAELCEIKRIPNIVFLKNNINISEIPPKFKLNSGHVKFFYNKIKYLHNRYLDLYDEAKNKRNYNISDYSESFEKIKKFKNHLYNDYNETQEDRLTLIDRLKERDYEYYKNLK